MSLKMLLENLYARRSFLYRENDPVSFCHRFTNPQDQEIVGLIASTLAYGNVKSIVRSVERVIHKMTPTPRRFIEDLDIRECKDRYSDFKHRFNDATDLCALFHVARNMIEKADSIGAYVASFHDSRADDVTSTIASFTHDVKTMDFRPIFGSRTPPAHSHFSFLFPSPSNGSACKRLCMYLRWMVRPADGIDLGLWCDISASQLIIPVDSHIERISRFLGFTTRRQPDWRMAIEITAALREFDPHDPVKYDFPLCHLGISEGCNGVDRSPCLTCPLAHVCGGNVV